MKAIFFFLCLHIRSHLDMLIDIIGVLCQIAPIKRSCIKCLYYILSAYHLRIRHLVLPSVLYRMSKKKVISRLYGHFSHFSLLLAEPRLWGVMKLATFMVVHTSTELRHGARHRQRNIFPSTPRIPRPRASGFIA